MSKVDVDVVIVSPMRRALTTCALVFKNHKSKAPIIVDPLFREIMESGCDIGSRLRESMKDYPDFDYSLIKNIDYWYIESLRNEASRK
jgi:broad specificity phosphatase PhoE